MIGALVICFTIASCTSPNRPKIQQSFTISKEVGPCKANELSLSIAKVQHGGFQLMSITGNQLIGLLIQIRTKRSVSCTLDTFLFPQFIGNNHKVNKMLVQQDAPWQPLGLKPIRINHSGEASFLLAYLDFSVPPPVTNHTLWAKIPCPAVNHIQFEGPPSQVNGPNKPNILSIGVRPKDVLNYTACPPIALASAPAEGLTAGGVWPPRYTPRPLVPTTTVPPPPRPGTLACAASQIKATAAYPSAGTGMLHIYFNFENISNTPCSVGGYPVMTFLDASGNVIPIEQGNSLPSGTTDTVFGVKPGGSFISYMAIAGHEPQSLANCPVSASMLYSIPGGTGTVTVRPVSAPFIPICGASFGTSPVAPGQYPASTGNNWLS